MPTNTIFFYRKGREYFTDIVTSIRVDTNGDLMLFWNSCSILENPLPWNNTFDKTATFGIQITNRSYFTTSGQSFFRYTTIDQIKDFDAA